MVTSDTPKLCECGCGNPAPIAKRTNSRLGHVKGHPVRFIVGHHNKVRPTRTIEERFWDKVDRRGLDECWEWTASTDPNGYGWLQVGTYEDPQAERAHRVSYELHHGPIPEGASICHACDNPSCVNPHHLFDGTHQDNMEDMLDKGRNSPPPRNNLSGEQVGSARFTNEQVRELREQFAALDVSIQSFAKTNGVPPTTMWRIIKRKSYHDA